MSFWLADPMEEALQSNAARKGDADYGAKSASKGQIKAEKKAASEAKKAEGQRRAKRKAEAKGGGAAADPNGPARGVGDKGGQFVSKGDEGQPTEEIQKKIGATVTGHYDAATASAVIAFQKKHGLVADGVVGRQTALALQGQYSEARRVGPGKLGPRTAPMVGQEYEPSEGTEAAKKAAKKKPKAKGRTKDRVTVTRSRERFGGGTLVEADVGPRSTMVALYPSGMTSHRLAVSGGESPSQIHLTLAFLGDLPDDKVHQVEQEVARAVRYADLDGITGVVSGPGTFLADQEKPVHVALVDAPSLGGLRSSIMGRLKTSGLGPREDHGFTPHMTLRYGGGAVKVEPGPVRFKEVRVVRGDETIARFPIRPRFGGLAEMSIDAHGNLHDAKGLFAKQGGTVGAAAAKSSPAFQGVPKYDASKLKFGKAAGGSNGARFADHADGSKWLVKSYNGDEDRVAAEVASNAIYRHMGARVPEAGRIKLRNGKHALSYPLVDGKPRPYAFKNGEPSEEIGKHFMTDALLANWDVAGLEDDNILWDPEGKPFRVDQGGTLSYRAQGQKKPFGPEVKEVESLMKPGKQGARSSKVSPESMRKQAAEIAERLTPAVIDGILESARFRDKKLQAEIAEALKGRVEWMRNFANSKLAEAAGRAFWMGVDDVLLEKEIGSISWDEALHPRDEHGRFIKTLLSGIKTGDSVRLDAKTTIGKDKDGTFRVTRSGGITKGFKTPQDAARDALDKSAKGTEADGIGGTTKFKDYNAYLKSRGFDPDKADRFGGKKIQTVDEFDPIIGGLSKDLAAAKSSDDVYTKRQVKTLEARLAEAKSKRAVLASKQAQLKADIASGKVVSPGAELQKTLAKFSDLQVGDKLLLGGSGGQTTYYVSDINNVGTRKLVQEDGKPGPFLLSQQDVTSMIVKKVGSGYAVPVDKDAFVPVEKKESVPVTQDMIQALASLQVGAAPKQNANGAEIKKAAAFNYEVTTTDGTTKKYAAISSAAAAFYNDKQSLSGTTVVKGGQAGPPSKQMEMGDVPSLVTLSESPVGSSWVYGNGNAIEKVHDGLYKSDGSGKLPSHYNVTIGGVKKRYKGAARARKALTGAQHTEYGEDDVAPSGGGQLPAADIAAMTKADVGTKVQGASGAVGVKINPNNSGKPMWEVEVGGVKKQYLGSSSAKSAMDKGAHGPQAMDKPLSFPSAAPNAQTAASVGGSLPSASPGLSVGDPMSVYNAKAGMKVKMSTTGSEFDVVDTPGGLALTFEGSEPGLPVTSSAWSSFVYAGQSGGGAAPAGDPTGATPVFKPTMPSDAIDLGSPADFDGGVKPGDTPTASTAVDGMKVKMKGTAGPEMTVVSHPDGGFAISMSGFYDGNGQLDAAAFTGLDVVSVPSGGGGPKVGDKATPATLAPGMKIKTSSGSEYTVGINADGQLAAIFPAGGFSSPLTQEYLDTSDITISDLGTAGQKPLGGGGDASSLLANAKPTGKPIKGVQTLGSIAGGSVNAKGEPAVAVQNLDLQPGDVVQQGTGTAKLTITGPYGTMGGLLATNASGKTKTIPGYIKVAKVQKADGSAVKKKSDGQAPNPMAPTGGATPGIAPQPSVTGPVPGSPGVPSKKQVYDDLLKKEDGLGDKLVGDYPDGSVIGTPSGKVFILQKATTAPDGFVTGLNIETGQTAHVKATVAAHAAAGPSAAGPAKELLAATQNLKAQEAQNAALKAQNAPPKNAVAAKAKAVGGSIANPDPKAGTQFATPIGSPDQAWHGVPQEKDAAKVFAAYQAKQMSKLPSKGKQAVGSYTGSSYLSIGPFMRGKWKSEAERKEGERLTKEMLTVFDQLDPIGQETIVYRKVRGTTGDFWKNAPVNAKLPDDGFQSASSSATFAKNWGGGSGTLLKIKLPADQKALWVAGSAGGVSSGGTMSVQGSSEMELILPPGTDFQVLENRKMADGMTMLVVVPIVPVVVGGKVV